MSTLYRGCRRRRICYQWGSYLGPLEQKSDWLTIWPAILWSAQNMLRYWRKAHLHPWNLSELGLSMCVGVCYPTFLIAELCNSKEPECQKKQSNIHQDIAPKYYESLCVYFVETDCKWSWSVVKDGHLNGKLSWCSGLATSDNKMHACTGNVCKGDVCSYQMKVFNAKPDISISSNFQDKPRKLSHLWRFVLKPKLWKGFWLQFISFWLVMFCLLVQARLKRIFRRKTLMCQFGVYRVLHWMPFTFFNCP